jgi:hypothetical protein
MGDSTHAILHPTFAEQFSARWGKFQLQPPKLTFSINSGSAPRSNNLIQQVSKEVNSFMQSTQAKIEKMQSEQIEDRKEARLERIANRKFQEGTTTAMFNI